MKQPPPPLVMLHCRACGALVAAGTNGRVRKHYTEWGRNNVCEGSDADVSSVTDAFYERLEIERKIASVERAAEKHERAYLAEKRKLDEAREKLAALYAQLRSHDAKRARAKKPAAERTTPSDGALPLFAIVLRLTEWPVSEQRVRDAFRARALQTHPDHGGTSEAFIAVREAYERALREAE